MGCLEPEALPWGSELGVVGRGQTAPGTFPCSPCNSGVNRELVLAGGGSLLLCTGSLHFRAIKTGLCSQDKAKSLWITHLDEVRCDTTAEVKRRFYSCLSSKHCSFCTSWASLNIFVILRKPVAVAEQEILQQRPPELPEEMLAPSPAAPRPVKVLPTLPYSWDPPHTIPLQPGVYCVCICLFAL